MCETNRVQQILTFKHCANDNLIFCFDIPDRCPLCEKEILKRDVDNTDEIEFNDDDHSIKEIKSLPNPLKAANKSKCALAIRPTKGDFLRFFITIFIPIEIYLNIICYHIAIIRIHLIYTFV